jgi:succinate dehydrogenase/fumarate reductase flavoprotein subunit
LITVAGAGMAGLVAAARLRELGVEPVVLEAGTRAGGSMLLSSCVIWRYRSFEDFRAECPGGDEELQRLVLERLDDGLRWLESLGAPVVWQETGNPRTVGKRFDPRGLTDALLARAGELRLSTPLPDDAQPPLVLATGGYPVRFARERGLLVRSNPWSDGGGIAFARARGAASSAGQDEFYGRNMPAPPARLDEHDFVPLAQLYGHLARVVDDGGREFFPREPSWSGIDLVQATARQRDGRAWYLVPRAVLGERIRERTVGEMIEAARAAGGEVVDRDDEIAVHVQAAVTHTIGGLRVDRAARVLAGDGRPLAGLYAAGVDVGGISTGGYASGLATALVLGLTAAESAAAAV